MAGRRSGRSGGIDLGKSDNNINLDKNKEIDLGKNDSYGSPDLGKNDSGIDLEKKPEPLDLGNLGVDKEIADLGDGALNVGASLDLDLNPTELDITVDDEGGVSIGGGINLPGRALGINGGVSVDSDGNLNGGGIGVSIGGVGVDVGYSECEASITLSYTIGLVTVSVTYSHNICDDDEEEEEPPEEEPQNDEPPPAPPTVPMEEPPPGGEVTPGNGEWCLFEFTQTREMNEIFTNKNQFLPYWSSGNYNSTTQTAFGDRGIKTVLAERKIKLWLYSPVGSLKYWTRNIFPVWGNGIADNSSCNDLIPEVFQTTQDKFYYFFANGVALYDETYPNKRRNPVYDGYRAYGIGQLGIPSIYYGPKIDGISLNLYAGILNGYSYENYPRSNGTDPATNCPIGMRYYYRWVKDTVSTNNSCDSTPELPPVNQLPSNRSLTPPTMNQDCCEELKKLMIYQIKKIGLDKIPVDMPKSVIQEVPSQNLDDNPGNDKKPDEPEAERIETLIDFLLYKELMDDERWGQWELAIYDKDSDPITDGNQEKVYRLPNLAEAIFELSLKIIAMEKNMMIANQQLYSLMHQAGLAQVAGARSYYMSEAIADYLGVELKEKKGTAFCAYDPDAKDFIKQVLEPKKLPFKRVEWDGDPEKDGLKVKLLNLMQAADIVRSQNFFSFNKREGIKEQIMNLIKGGANVSKWIGEKMAQGKDMEELLKELKEQGYEINLNDGSDQAGPPSPNG